MNKSEKFWDKRSKNFDKSTSKNGDTVSKAIESIKKYLNKTDIVLDYGCATGAKSIDMADYVKEIDAIDISSKMIEIANKKIGELNIKNIKFSQSTIFDERFENESYNAVLSFNVLHLLEDRQKALQRIYELLKPGGLLISKTPSLKVKKSFMGLLQLLLSKTGIVPNLNMSTNSELRDQLVKENFKIIESENLNKSLTNPLIVAKKM